MFKKELDHIKNSGLYKDERVIESPQDSIIKVNNKDVMNFCANNYLGLSNDPEIIQAAVDGIKEWGFGLSSVRFICGTQSIHKRLENDISDFLNKEDTILYTSCFDAKAAISESSLRYSCSPLTIFIPIAIASNITMRSCDESFPVEGAIP